MRNFINILVLLAVILSPAIVCAAPTASFTDLVARQTFTPPGRLVRQARRWELVPHLLLALVQLDPVRVPLAQL